MADGVSANVISTTQAQLGKYVKRPPLTAKLLSRPPFKYLHDIFSAIIKEHRFMEGLFTDTESAADNLRERDAKIAYLDKVIRIVGLANDKELPVRPSSIIAGKEVGNTNLLLQELAVAIEKRSHLQGQNAELVKRVLAGEGPAKKSKKPPKEQPAESRDDKKKQADSKDKDKDRRKDDKDRHRDDKDRRRDDKDKRRDDKDDKKKDERRQDGSGDRPKEERRGSRDERTGSRDERRGSRDERRGSRDERSGSRDERRGSRDERRGSRDRQEEEKPKDRSRQAEQEQEAADEEDDANGRLQRPSSAKGNRRLREGRRQSQADEEMQRSLKDDEAAATRAPSARPAPRVKAAASSGAVEDSGARKVAGVIIERDQDSDDDQFVVEEAPASLLGAGGGDAGLGEDDDAEGEGDAAAADGEQQHGGLVKEMLRSKKELSESNAKDASPKRGVASTADAARRQAKAATEKEIAKLKQDLQALTRSANPLGKVIDFIQEDLESMRKELEKCQADTSSVTAELIREQGAADASLNGLRHKLQELQQEEKDKLDMIATVKANIERNDERITRMIEAMSKA